MPVGDDGATEHTAYGGSARAYITPRLSFEPELLFLYHSSNDKDLIVIPNIAFDFRQGSRIVPYVVGGAGLLHGFRRFGSINDTIVSAGFGLKLFVADRFYISPDIRLGSPPHLRFSLAVGRTSR